MVAAWSLVALLGLSWWAWTGRDRSPTIHRYTLAVMIAGGIPMALAQDYWPLALWVVLCGNALRKPWPMTHLAKLGTAGVFYALYRFAHDQLTGGPMPILLGLVAVSCAGACLWWINRTRLGNRNHAHMLFVMGFAACLALSMLHHPAWSVLSLFLLAPLWKFPGQSWIWVACAGLAGLAVIFPLLAIGLALIGVCTMAPRAWRCRMSAQDVDHGRVWIWSILLFGWWHSGWMARWLGLGWGSWTSWADSFSQLEQRKTGLPPKHAAFMTHPHNEYVHLLFEHGVIGLLLLCGWIGSLLWQTWQVEPALLIPAVTLCAIAMTCFPWTTPYEVAVPKKQYIDYTPFGCMGMVITTLCILVLLP